MDEDSTLRPTASAPRVQDGAAIPYRITRLQCFACVGKGTVLDSTYNRTGDEVECGKCFGTGKSGKEIQYILSHPSVVRNTRQALVAEWCAAAFGIGAASSIPQRGVRLLEEAIELYQAAGCDAAMAHKLVDFVFARPVGKLGKEIGQVGLVLLSMAHAAGLSADAEEAKEVVRVREKPPEHYAERNKAKNAAGFDTATAPVDAVEEQGSRNRETPPSSPSLERVAVLEEALRECGADWKSPPCTLAEAPALLWAEFIRRAQLARATVEDSTND